MRVVHIAQHARAAAHIGHFAVVIAILVILQIERRVDEAEIGEEAFGRSLHGQREQIVVGIARTVVDPLLDLENLHRKNGGFAVTQAGLSGKEQVFHHHATLGGSVCAIIDGTERHLGSGAGIHGVQVVDQGFHGLIHAAIRIAQGLLHGIAVGASGQFPPLRGRVLSQGAGQRLGPGPVRGGSRTQAGCIQQLRRQRPGRGGIQVARDTQTGAEGLAIFLGVGFGHAGRHGKVKVRHALAAVHFILVGLNGNAGQSRITFNGIGFAQIAVPGGEAVSEQRNQVNLAAGFREHVKIFVMDVDVAVGVRGRGVLGQNVVVDKKLGTLGAVFEHGAHGRVAVDIGVFPLDVLPDGRGVRQLFVNIHEIRFRVAYLGMLGAVENIGLGGFGVIVLDEAFLHHVLNFFHMAKMALIQLFADFFRDKEQIRGGHVLAAHGLIGLGDGVENLDGIKGRGRTVPFGDGGGHETLRAWGLAW